MAWHQLSFTVTPEAAEQLSDALYELGACAVTFQDAADHPIFEPELNTTPLWGNTQVTALFEQTTDMTAILKQLEQNFAGNIPAYQLSEIADQDWERAWLDSFQPMQFGRRLWICPSWHTIPDPDAVNLLLDPGLAFGTGTHPTTRLCLEWLDANPPIGKTVIDYGCGSGILGLAALKLGAQHIWAVDHDPQALLATRENAERNHITLEQLTLVKSEDMPSIQADIIVANILAQPLIELAPKFLQLLKPNGKLILSGILAEQADAVMQAYQEQIKRIIPVVLEDWVRLEGTLI